MIRVLLVDDQALIRSGIRALLDAEDDIEVIAAAMVLSPMTVKTHVSRAMTKLGARDRAQLVVFAYQTGLVSPRDPSPLRHLRPEASPADNGDDDRAARRAASRDERKRKL